MRTADEQIPPEQKKIFRESELFLLFKFLRSQKAKMLVKFKPELNPNTFTFSLRQIKKVYPHLQLENFIGNIEKYGINIEINADQICTIKHDTLTLYSNPLQLYDIWIIGETAHFLNSEQFLPEIYCKLNKNTSKSAKTIYWTKDHKLTINKKYQCYENIRFLLEKYGFMQIVQTKDKLTVAKHPRLNKDSSIVDWIVVQLTGNRTFYKEADEGRRSLTVSPKPLQLQTTKVLPVVQYLPNRLPEQTNLIVSETKQKKVNLITIDENQDQKNHDKPLIQSTNQDQILCDYFPGENFQDYNISKERMQNFIQCVMSSVAYKTTALKMEMFKIKQKFSFFPLVKLSSYCNHIIKYEPPKNNQKKQPIFISLNQKIAMAKSELSVLVGQLKHERMKLEHLLITRQKVNKTTVIERNFFSGDSRNEVESSDSPEDFIVVQ